ncbi:hypothetical protein A33M_0470 [Rhodovulum sp. PH10]|uniref:hypothetical protein n=1 Tax=Rhodovulum sp. PH10 TaxID=1187851 RepID=UPI00027C2982|nr:hypothetical protein [Rhodovulum sp. PH10]EJW10121.1 hypothetical protein A33M_0470 [Rhodovulum sp. PH10]
MDDPLKPKPDAGRAGGERQMAQWELEALALREKTERLKALRLAREAAEGPAPAKKRSVGTRSGATKTAKGGTSPGRAAASAADKSIATLSDWLKMQEEQGRRR